MRTQGLLLCILRVMLNEDSSFACRQRDFCVLFTVCCTLGAMMLDIRLRG
jgi:hypothetical protein